MEKKELKIAGISIWRLLAYFIIYSIIGFLIETMYAFVLYGVVESRQSFLYGPFCSIYGLGAVAMICTLQYFGKNVHTLFLGGFISGSITEYIVSFVGEKLLNTSWWDYSDKFLNINGRICFIYSVFWGLLGLYLMKVINPKVDKLIEWIKSKISINKLRTITMIVIIGMFVDCVVSGIAIDCYLTRTTIEKKIEVSHKELAEKKYNYLYKENAKLGDFINKIWGNKTMVITYPNLTIQLADGSVEYLKNYYPEIQPYYLKLKK